jgi:hypothetical protein
VPELSLLSPELAKVLLEAIAGHTTAGTAAGPPDPGKLQSLLDSIPTVEDGDVIRAEQWNAMRAALRQLAGSIDEAQLARVTVRSFTPALLTTARDVTGWVAEEGRAVGPTEGAEVAGWMPLDLPDGTDIDVLTVRGRRTTDVDSWTVVLRRMELSGANPLNLCLKDLKAEPTGEDGQLTVDVALTTDGLTASQLAERRRVDTSRYRYVFRTRFTNAAQPSGVTLDAVQVTTTRT